MLITRRPFAIAMALALLSIVLTTSRPARAESQNDDYKGVTDPFGDPAQYEFAEDEKEDKEFFHLGRFLMVGLDMGVGLYTGGLGTTNTPGFYAGGHLLYFFDRSIAMEAAAHFSSSVDTLKSTAAAFVATVNTTLIPVTLGFRYYFNTSDAPRAIAIANPYLALGAGIYIRSQNVTSQASAATFNTPQTSTGNFGANGGGGIEFLIYHRHIYLGVDVRYHLVFFGDSSSDLNGNVPEGSRGGNYFTTNASITYSF